MIIKYINLCYEKLNKTHMSGRLLLRIKPLDGKAKTSGRNNDLPLAVKWMKVPLIKETTDKCSSCLPNRQGQ